MTVAEMIKELEKLNPEAVVNIQNGDVGGDYAGSREALFIEEKHYTDEPIQVLIS